MSKIDQITEDRIKASAKITDILEEHGVELHRRGRSLLALCPFHNDRHIGSFVVNERANMYKCFSCDASGDPIKFLMDYDHMEYPDALRHIAAKYGIYIDDQPVPVVKRCEPRQPLQPTKMICWPIDIIEPYLHHDNNPLLTWMLALPFKPEHLKTLTEMLDVYKVGTSIKGETSGWTVFPQIDMDMRIRDMKLMAYRSDGHRDKDRKYSFNWMHSMLAKAGAFDEDAYHVEHCLFGLHLAALFPKAEVCIVESEKSALICSAFSDPNEKIWMATGGKSGLNPDMLRPLIESKRPIVLYPDIDGYEEWEERMHAIDYRWISISQKPRQLHSQEDGDKADMADIMIRIMHGIEESEAEVVARRLCAEHQVKEIADMMDKLDLHINDDERSKISTPTEQ